MLFICFVGYVYGPATGILTGAASVSYTHLDEINRVESYEELEQLLEERLKEEI